MLIQFLLKTHYKFEMNFRCTPKFLLVMEIHLMQKIQNSTKLKNFKHTDLRNFENVYDSRTGIT
jgi:hypothetical protein